MRTLLAIRGELIKCDGYKAGQNATEFRNANPDAAKKIASMIKGNMPALISELSGVLLRK